MQSTGGDNSCSRGENNRESNGVSNDNYSEAKNVDSSGEDDSDEEDTGGDIEVKLEWNLILHTDGNSINMDGKQFKPDQAHGRRIKTFSSNSYDSSCTRVLRKDQSFHAYIAPKFESKNR